ncbi:Wzz/FepE/Etk N-terminal domain-containing protein [Campylobacter ureolyticus]|uniref:Wzz/FepE/Etk N-terminal domain-containing protein n=1 Tax=Campylobacter ureolyticus TaxID=827 RepID=A0A9Q4KSA5_9BACT|nr:Wzz/FepE/Etk N-terminal domain-containing protein [Campylobacter ureolyticus]MCZ6103542.1 Wzz/FepE/Etk N-terminal domain-containing protein [Campylobacter ureolyticus]MCZ6134032.1 Wzz/FepE/Etk N-terminal domain-containing protein [Campylobacter ureolyticus]MCZ6161773.1 Wzz/FepE/Etk N-terminal domain-containing protein [Campylobacter ureolyticus]MCZ6170638.1 Wzz/FepE/Etk N-terminal domain-containing protein [Campylobacter ureolyticus]MDU4981675.1 Wzz/FepE/Etk N-terminal domain-containing pro
MNKEEILIKDDEIDLVELFKTLWGYKIIIFLVTFLFMVLGAIYAFIIATPKYEISATFENGYYKTSISDKTPINDKSSIINTLNVKFIDELKNQSNLDFKFDSIKDIEKSNNFKIVILANNNEIGISKMNEVLSFLEINDQKSIDNYVKNIKQQIEILKNQNLNLESNKKNFEIRIDDLKQIVKKLDNQLDNLSRKDDLSSQIQFNKTIDLKNASNLEISAIEKNIMDLDSDYFQNKSDILGLEKKIESENIQKTHILSNIVTYENPVKPKKALILLISCFVGFFVSIFGVLILDAVKIQKGTK